LDAARDGKKNNDEVEIVKLIFNESWFTSSNPHILTLES
jgi:hypothetical protein